MEVIIEIRGEGREGGLLSPWLNFNFQHNSRLTPSSSVVSVEVGHQAELGAECCDV